MNKYHRMTERNLENELKVRSFPRCFDSSSQYKDWLEQEAIAKTVPIRRNICEDCDLEYKNSMVASGRCANIQVILKK